MRRSDKWPELAMWLILVAMVLTIMVPASCNGEDYSIPRSVGLNIQIPDTGTASAPWWADSPSQPLRKTLEYVRDELNVTAVGHFLRSHPWDNSKNAENIRRAFRAPGLEIIQITPQYWGSPDRQCVDGVIRTWAITWGHWPTDRSAGLWAEALGTHDPRRSEILDRHQSIYRGLYQYYGNQKKHIIVTNNEATNQLYRDECSREHCDLLGYWCDEMGQACCDERRREKADWLLEVWTERQRSAEAARSSNPDATLKVWNAIEVSQYERTDERPIVPLCDIIPRMPHLPDRIGLSGLANFGDPGEALRFAMACTGLPVHRFYISEVGKKVGRPPGQYRWIYDTVDALFEKGVAFAMVWALNTELSYVPNWPFSVVDPITHEWRPGMYAIQDLNKKWRKHGIRRVDRRRPGRNTSEVRGLAGH